MVAVVASVRFSERHVSDETFQIVSVLVDNPEIHGGAIRFQGLLSSDTLRIGVDVVSVKETHDVKSFIAKGFQRVYDTRGAADVKKDFHFLSPKIAVPIRTRVAPSWMATSKSPVIPMESSSRETSGGVSWRIRSLRFRSPAK